MSQEDVLDAGTLSSVRNRVLQWQLQVGSTGDSDDSASEISVVAPLDRRKVQQSCQPETEKPVPSRRVISDGHWRKTRRSSKDEKPTVRTPTRQRLDGSYVKSEEKKGVVVHELSDKENFLLRKTRSPPKSSPSPIKTRRISQEVAAGKTARKTSNKMADDVDRSESRKTSRNGMEREVGGDTRETCNIRAPDLRKEASGTPHTRKVSRESPRTADRPTRKISHKDPVHEPVVAARIPSIETWLMGTESSTVGPAELGHDERRRSGRQVSSEKTDRRSNVPVEATGVEIKRQHRNLLNQKGVRRRPVPSAHHCNKELTDHTELLTALSHAEDIVPLQEFLEGEKTYMEELNLILDGIIPSLLSCLLSKSDSAATLTIIGNRRSIGPSLATALVATGVTLERLRSLHRRVPQNSVRDFVAWAHGAQRAYTDYLTSWRLDFSGVMLSMTSLTQQGAAPLGSEDVSVVHMLKRPLIRLKYLAKALDKVQSPDLAAFQLLVDEARRKVVDESARLEDEAAASIDTSCAVTLHDLSPANNVCVPADSRVKARDRFMFFMPHRSASVVTCETECIFRSEDVLICEWQDQNRWLKFPPIPTDTISARRGTSACELVVMVADHLFCLRSTDEHAIDDWLQMLGQEPIPPELDTLPLLVEESGEEKTIDRMTVIDEEPSKPQEKCPVRIAPQRSSSPLKHEYDPSTASDTELPTDGSVLPETDSSDEDEFWRSDKPLVLRPVSVRSSSSIRLPSRGTQQLEDAALASRPPSSSSSQSLPSRGTQQLGDAALSSRPLSASSAAPAVCHRTIAMVFSWSETGTWKKLYPDECSIAVSAGLIEAFEISASHSAFVTEEQRPLIALELTPLVPVRRGTALDITIRSPPTSKSQASPSDNFLFRSRVPVECEALHSMISHACITNPAYIAMQNAAPILPMMEIPKRAPSYRASSTSPRKSGILRLFGRKTVDDALKASDGNIDSLGTSSENSSLHSRPFQGVPAMAADANGSLALRDAAIRLYVRESSSKWRTLGAAMLTIVRAEMDPQDGSLAPKKRLLVRGKIKCETMIDATLGESCYERIARTGIAVSIWEDAVGPDGEIGVVGAIGGVVGGHAKVYMLQFKTEAETAFAFSLVGKLRY